MGNPRKSGWLDGNLSDRREAARQAEQVRQNDQLIHLLGQLLAAQHETNRLLALDYFDRHKQWPPPAQPG